MTLKWQDLSLFITILCTGLYGGMGFYAIMGMNPAIQKMTVSTFAEYWQHTDFYMAARMKYFGPVMLVSMIVSTIQLYRASQAVAFWCLLLALAVLVADIVFMIGNIHPLNQLIQGWNLQNLPADAGLVKGQLASAFGIRALLMISSFVLTLAGAFLRK